MCVGIIANAIRVFYDSEFNFLLCRLSFFSFYLLLLYEQTDIL